MQLQFALFFNLSIKFVVKLVQCIGRSSFLLQVFCFSLCLMTKYAISVQAPVVCVLYYNCPIAYGNCISPLASYSNWIFGLIVNSFVLSRSYV